MQQGSLFTIEELNPIPDTGWTTPKEFPRLEHAAAIALDAETYDPHLLTHGPGWGRGDGHLVGLSVGVQDPNGQTHTWYFPMRHELGGGNLDPAMVLKWAQRELGRERQPKVGANLEYDLGWLAEEGVVVRGPLIDVQYAEPLLDEHRPSYSLDSLAETHLGESKVDEALYDWLHRAYGGPKGRKQAANIYRAPVALVGPYAEGDVDLPLRIWERQRPLLEQQGLMELFELECALIPILVEMRRRGTRVDVAKAEEARELLLAEEATVAKQLRHLCGFDVNVDASADLRRAFDAAGLSYPTTAKGNPSFTAAFLETCPGELGKLIRAKRRAAKTRGTFIEGYILDKQVDGVLRGSFHPLRSDDGGTVSGRFSSCLPGKALILTEHGEVPLTDVRVGQRVVTHTGEWRPVLNRWFNGEHKTFKIYLESGHSVECTSNHRLLTDQGWLSLEDIYERLYGKSTGPEHLSESCGDVPWGGQANGGGSWESDRGGLPYGDVHLEARYLTGAVQGGEGLTILPQQDGSEQPNDRENPRQAPRVQGGITRKGWLFDRTPSGVVHREPDSKSCGAPSHSDVRGARDYRGPEGLSCAPYQRGPGGQPSGEPSPRVRVSASRDTQVYAPIRAVEYVGVQRVYDLEVEADHCFVADGVYVHNSNPNWQNLPSRDKATKQLVRGLCLPWEGEEWHSLDYSQIEYRFLAHYALGPGAEELRQVFRDDPKADFHEQTRQLILQVTGKELERKPTKSINFGLCYGMSEAKLKRELRLTDAEGDELFHAYHTGAPFVKHTYNVAMQRAAKRGYIRTVGGRYARFDRWEPRRWDDRDTDLPRAEAEAKWGAGAVQRSRTHKALNALLQGSSADLIKRALVDIYRELGLVPLNTVHDELNFSLPAGPEGHEAAREVKRLMEQAVRLNVPVVCDAEYGPNWAELRPLPDK